MIKNQSFLEMSFSCLHYAAKMKGISKVSDLHNSTDLYIFFLDNPIITLGDIVILITSIHTEREDP